jgi:Ca2+-binding EF-hand superfamily protein
MGPPLGKKPPVPDYWLESLRLQLLRKSLKSRISGSRSVSLKDFVLALVTRAMGVASMTDAERAAYLEWVQVTANSQLACLFRDMLRQGVIRAGAEVYRERCLAAEKERLEKLARLHEIRSALTTEEQVELLVARSDLNNQRVKPVGEDELRADEYYPHRRELTLIRDNFAKHRDERLAIEQAIERRDAEAHKKEVLADAVHNTAEFADMDENSGDLNAAVLTARMDVGGDGQIDLPEFLMSSHKWGVGEDAAKELFLKLDNSGDGFIDEEEMAKGLRDHIFSDMRKVGVKKANKFISTDEAASMFHHLDGNGSGSLEGDEVVGLAAWVIESFTEEDAAASPELLAREADKLYQACDKDGSGTIDMDEFVNYYKRLASALAGMSPKSPRAKGGTPKASPKEPSTAAKETKQQLGAPSINLSEPEQAAGAGPLTGAEQRAKERRERIAAKTAREDEKRRLQEEPQKGTQPAPGAAGAAGAESDDGSADFHSDDGND